MKKLILIAVLMLVSSSVFAQDIFGPPNYFFKRNDSVFVRPGSVFGSASSQSIDTSLIAFLNQNNTFTGDQTLSDSTTFLGGIWQLGTVTDRPIVYQRYSESDSPLQSFVGQAGVGEMNIGLNLDYRLGVHNYFDSTKPIDYLTININGITWQHIPKGYANVTELPDSWANSGNTTPLFIDTSGFMGIIGGLTSIFKTKGNPIIGTTTANDYTDTTLYNFYGRGGKTFIDNKMGVGTTTPFGIFHTVNKATTRATSGYNGATDWVLQDDGVSDRAQLELRSPTGSLIAFGNQTTYNLSYLQYVNSSSTLNIVGTTINLSGTIQDNGTALTSKYAILGNTNTFVNDQIFSGRVRTDTVLNVLGALTINDTVNVTGRLNLAQTTFASNDIVTLSTKGYVVGFNSGGTTGVYLNSTADNFLRIRNAGVSTDAIVQMGSLITSTLTPPANASASGTAGEWRLGSDGWIYICTATNTWLRVQALTW